VSNEEPESGVLRRKFMSTMKEGYKGEGRRWWRPDEGEVGVPAGKRTRAIPTNIRRCGVHPLVGAVEM
jgi:hypothetical protein